MYSLLLFLKSLKSSLLKGFIYELLVERSSRGHKILSQCAQLLFLHGIEVFCKSLNVPANVFRAFHNAGRFPALLICLSPPLLSIHVLSVVSFLLVL